MKLTNLTRRILPALLGLILCSSINAQDNLIFEDFEDASVNYTTNPAEFSDGTSDFFTRTDGSNISGSYGVTGFQGSSYFAAQDVDGDQAVIPVQMVLTGDISNHTDLNFSVLLAEDDDGSNQDWDNPDYVTIEYSIDGGQYLSLICVHNDGSGINMPPYIDSDCDGIGEGAEITSLFTSYGASIAETGNSITIRITINLDSGDEDIAFDNILLSGILASDPGDNEDPVASCAPLGSVTAEIDQNGIATVNAESLDGGSTDNFGIASFDASPASFTCVEIGAQPVMLTVTDTNGNTATCTTDIQVVDLLGPVLSVNEEITVTLDASGNVMLDPNTINNGTTDNCGVLSTNVGPNSLNCSDAFDPNPLTTDLIISEYVEGSSYNKYLEIYNGTGHAVDMADYELQLFSNGAFEATISEGLAIAGILNNGETVVFGNSQAEIYSGSYYNSAIAGFNGNDLLVLFTSVNTESLKLIDLFGDLSDPQPTAWTNGAKSTADHTLRRKRTILHGSVSAMNSNFLNEWEQFDQDDVSDLGMHYVEDTPAEVSFSATDNNGNVSTETISVKVMDNIAPQFLDQIDDIVLSSEFGQCTQAVYYDYPDVEDNCSGEIKISSNHPSGSTFFSGETLVTVTATDPSGNTDQVQFTVTILVDPLTAEVSSYRDYVCPYQEGADGTPGQSIYSTIQGGCRPYTYVWNGEEGTSSLEALTGGTFNLVVTDANGETASATITLADIPLTNFDVTQINPSCTDGANGSLVVTNRTGGSGGPYITAWYLEELGPDGDFIYDIFDVDSIGGLQPGLVRAYVMDSLFCPTFQDIYLINEDLTPPTPICGSTTLTLNASGTAILDPSDLDAGSTDDCGNLSFSASQEIFDCTNLGDNEITLFVADDSLNTSTCLANVTVIDNLPPELVVHNTLNFSLDNSGQVVIDANLFDIGSTDNCGITEFTVDPSTLSCADIGEGPGLTNDLLISEYVEGSSNNKYIEIYNGTGASVDLSNYVLRLYTNGSSNPTSASLSPAGMLADGATAVFKNSSANIYSGTSFNNGAVNFNGNDAMALFNSVTGQNVDIFGVMGVDPGSYWSGNGINTQNHTLRRISTVTSGNTNPTNANFLDEYEQYAQDDVSGLGAHSLGGGGGTEITFTATDASGNSTSTTVTATVIDNTPPVFTDFPVDLTTESNSATCSALVNWAEPTASDNCEATLSSDHASGEAFTTGETTVTYTATDPFGNSVSQSFTITVTSPTLMSEVAIDDVVHCNGGTAEVHAEATGGCQPYTFSWDGVAGSATQTVSAGNHTLLLTDVNGNVVTKDFSIDEPSALAMTLDATNPTCASIADGAITAAVSGGTPSYSIIWSGDAIGVSNPLSNIGNGTYTATVTDLEGCMLSETAVLNGIDTIPPTLLVGNSFLDLLPNGMTSVLMPAYIDNGSYDNCGDVTISLSRNQWDCSELGENELIVTGTDEAGNTTTRVVYVYVLDNSNPALSAQNIDLPLDASGTAHLDLEDLSVAASDNCGIASLEITGGQVDYSCEDLGQTFAVTLTAIDPFGNMTNATAEVTIVDNIAPIFTSFPEDIIATSDPATCSAIVTWTDPEALENCLVYILYSHHSGDAFPVGVTTVTATAADLSGNTISQSFTVTVTAEDLLVSISQDQDILCHGGTTNLSTIVSGGCQPYDYNWDGQAGGASLSANAGLHTLVVTDASGASASADITLAEPSDLAVSHSSTQPSCSAGTDGEVSVAISGGTAPYYIAWSGDAAGTGNTLSNLGNGTYTATITDNNGCSVSEFITLDGTDVTPPTAICGNATLYLNAQGQATLDPSVLDGGSSDNCGNISLSVSQAAFDCSDLGSNQITLTVTDGTGMTNACTSTVTVVDNLAPVVTTQDIDISLDPTGYALVGISEINDATSDNCGLASLEITSGQTQYGCEDVGQTFEVTLTAFDFSGNESSSVSQVTVVPGDDTDGDGVSDACDICEGDDSLGDADGDGICDELQQFCPGGEAIADPTLTCNIETNVSGTFNANQNQIYCISGPFVNQNIKLTNGSTVRLSGNGILRLSIGTNCAVEIMSGSNITFNSISMGWNARGLVVHPGAEMSINGFAPGEPVVNCGTINCSLINMGWQSSFLNNGTVNTTDINFTYQSGFINNGTLNCDNFSAGYGSSFTNNGALNSTGVNENNQLDGTLVNYGTVEIAGKLTQSYNGHIDNYCTILIGKDFNVGKDVKNYALVSVGGNSKLAYNARVFLYNGAMYQTYSTQISGRYIGNGSPSLVKVQAITTADWNAKVQGSIYFCDANGIESISNPNGLTINGALKSCELNIPISDCNPIGNVVLPSALVLNGDGSQDGNDALQTDGNMSTDGNVSTTGFENSAGTQGKRDAITLFPNPTEGKARITFTPQFDSGVTISVYNVSGQKLQEFKPSNQIAGQPYEALLDLSKYDNGVYFIQVIDQAQTETKKLVLAK